MGAGGEFEGGDVAFECGEGAAVGIEEDDVAGAAGEAFEAHGAGAAEEIGYAGAGDVGGEDVEEGLFGAVGDGAGGIGGGGLDFSAAVFAGDDSHGG